MTLLECMLEPGPGLVTILGRRGQVEHIERDPLLEDARRVGAGLRAEGVDRGDVVGIVIRPDLDAISGLIATWTIGATALVLPSRGPLEERERWSHRTSDILERASARLAILPETEPDARASPSRTTDELRHDDQGPLQPPAPDDAALLRLSSGTSGPVKLVPRSHAALRAQLDRDQADEEGLTPGTDRRLGWGPLHTHHLLNDVLYPIAAGVDTVLVPTRRVTEDPLRWLVEMSAHRATYSAAANFAYDLVASRIEAGTADDLDLDLSAWRLAHCGGEAIDPATFERFAAATERWGFDPRALRAIYGSSEFGRITATPPDERWHTDRIRPSSLAAGRAAPATSDDPDAVRLLSVGHPPSDVEIRIRTERGHEAPERVVGDIVARRPEMTSGYVGDEDASRRRFRDGWFHTGDLGYHADDQLYIVGRADDTIIVRGRNLQPAAIEHELAAALGDGVDTVALTYHRDRASTTLTVLIEASDPPDDLRATVDPILNRLAGVTATDITVLAPGTLPRNTSGKLDRRKLTTFHQRT